MSKKPYGEVVLENQRLKLQLEATEYRHAMMNAVVSDAPGLMLKGDYVRSLSMVCSELIQKFQTEGYETADPKHLAQFADSITKFKNLELRSRELDLKEKELHLRYEEDHTAKDALSAIETFLTKKSSIKNG